MGMTPTGGSRDNPDPPTRNYRHALRLCGFAAAWPFTSRAQQPAMPVIGFLHMESFDLFADRLRAFRQGLSQTGHIERRSRVKLA
jgi:putative tryptophan/tyrosine transport system substrate-binding protein